LPTEPLLLLRLVFLRIYGFNIKEQETHLILHEHGDLIKRTQLEYEFISRGILKPWHGNLMVIATAWFRLGLTVVPELYWKDKSYYKIIHSVYIIQSKLL